VVAGPFALGMVSQEATTALRPLDDVALAIIGLAAGSELHLPELITHGRAISYTVGCLVTCTFAFLFLTMVLFTHVTGLFAAIPGHGATAACLLGSTILMSRSPASAIAVVKELRATGPFTTIALSVSIAMDVVIIVLFSVNVDIARLLIGAESPSIAPLLLPFGKLVASFLVGIGLGRLLQSIVAARVPLPAKSAAAGAAGFGVFLLARTCRAQTGSIVDLEPLLSCVLGSVVASNLTPYREEYQAMLDQLLPKANVVFFPLAGASLALDTLRGTFGLAFTLFFVRLCALWIGTHIAGYLASLPVEHSRVRWMAFVTQAGLATGLARQVAALFPAWGPAFASLIIAVVMLNELVGPPLFRYSLVRAGEAKPLPPESGHHPPDPLPLLPDLVPRPSPSFPFDRTSPPVRDSAHF